jgi:hypothetical protein
MPNPLVKFTGFKLTNLTIILTDACENDIFFLKINRRFTEVGVLKCTFIASVIAGKQIIRDLGVYMPG